jgi:hypothetical protein
MLEKIGKSQVVCVSVCERGGGVCCRIPVSVFWGKWHIGVSPYRVPVSV